MERDFKAVAATSDDTNKGEMKEVSSASADRPEILDAVMDKGDYWYRVGTEVRSSWFSLSQLHEAESEVFRRLAGPGMPFLTSTSRNDLKKALELPREYRLGNVAECPGWTGGYYAFGDGTVRGPSGLALDVIVAFKPDSKFTPVGTLKGWKAGIGPAVANQALPLFALAYAFVGPLLRFAPPNILNPQVELVGRHESGKTTIAIMAASVWAGDPKSEIAGGESWDMTINALDPIRLAHADTLLFLDEANLAGTNERDRREVLRKAVFKNAVKGGRKRLNEVAPPAVSVALLSTSNTPLFELIQATDADKGAMSSRMVTVQIDPERPHRALDSVPEGFENAGAAIKSLSLAAYADYGVAGRQFIRKLVKAAADEPKLRRRVQKHMDRFLRRLEKRGLNRSGSARVANTFAITYAAGVLARTAGVLPKEWGRLIPALLEVFSWIEGGSRDLAVSGSLARVLAYKDAHQADLVEVSDISSPLTRKAFRRARGFQQRYEGYEEILIPAERFREHFPDHQSLMKELRLKGYARTERGKKPKLTIKAPRSISESGRVYCVKLNGDIINKPVKPSR